MSYDALRINIGSVVRIKPHAVIFDEVSSVVVKWSALCGCSQGIGFGNPGKALEH